MPAAYLPTPANAVWHLGVIPVRTYAVCMVAGVVAGLWLTARRYRRAGYRPRVLLDVATVAVPVGVIGARIYSLLTNSDRYFGAGRDWTDAMRVWDGGMGVAGAVAAGALGAWWYCRRTGIEIGPVALAAVPALAVAQAISVWGNLFSQELYGRPSGLPWAVHISPQHRVSGFQAFATFQPLFLYESLFDVALAIALTIAIRRFLLSGGQAFALYAAVWALGSGIIESLRIDSSAKMFGLRTNMIAMAVVFVLACSYLIALRRQRLMRLAIMRTDPSAPQRALRPRSSRAASGNLGITASDDQPNPAPGSLPGSRL
jgi:prolipoprotein diacylglyceryl transferase